MSFRMYVELNKNISCIKKTSPASDSSTEHVPYKCMNILTKMFQDLNIDSDMLDANEHYFVSTYISDFK